jgi:Zinc carboxypeptidase
MGSPRHLGVALAALLAIPAAAQAVTTSLPAVKRSLSATGSTKSTCYEGLQSGRGTATTTYRAPMSGFVDVRSSSVRGDWDLAIYDARNPKRALQGSNGFDSREVVQAWTTAGQRFVIQGCRHSGAGATLPVAITFTDAVRPKSDMAPQMLRITVKRADLARLEGLGVDVTHSVRVGSVDALVSTTKQLQAVRDAGFKYRVLDSNVLKAEAKQAELSARYSAATAASPLPTGRTEYRNLEDYEAELKQIVAKYPGIARPVELPHKSFQGRPLMGVELSDNVGAKDDGKPTYFVMGTHHAREWPAGEIAMEYAWYVAKGYGSDAEVTDVLKRERIVVVPIINPDGYVVSRTTPSAYDTTGQGPFDTAEAVATGGFGAYRRKNCDGAVPSGEFPCLLQWGVDPNRNYGEGWGAAGASSIPYTQTYRGAGPWSEPETQAVHEFSRERQVTALITLHNFASLVLRSPSLAVKGKAIDEDRLKQLGDEMAADTGYTSQYGWQLYDTSGTTEDWNYAAAGTYGYTIELGPADWQGGQFHIEYPRAVVDQWTGRKSRAGKGMRAALMTMADAAANPADHAIIKGSAPAGSILRVKRSFQTETGSAGSECALADPTDVTGGCYGSQASQKVPDFVESTTVVPASGQYEWHVGPSTRPFVFGTRFPSKDVKDGRTDTINGAAPPDQSGGAGGPNDHVDHPFTITDADSARKVTITLEWTGGVQDMDMEVYKKTSDPDEPQQVATSGNPPGQTEEAVLESPDTGDYFVRVVNFLAAPGTPYTLTIKRQTAGPDTITITGKTEAWHMTCETPDGKVQEARDVTVWRGDVSQQNFSCGQAPGVPGVKKQPKAKKPKLTKRQACLKRANRVRGKAKRRAAVKRCNKRYPAKKKSAKRR